MGYGVISVCMVSVRPSEFQNRNKDFLSGMKLRSRHKGQALPGSRFCNGLDDVLHVWHLGAFCIKSSRRKFWLKLK